MKRQIRTSRPPRAGKRLLSILIAGGLSIGLTIPAPAAWAQSSVTLANQVQTAADSSAMCPAPSNNKTPAQAATVSASYTASWNNISAVSDGTSVYTGGAQTQLWGTYSSTRPAQQWLEYDWYGPATLTGAAISFWHDQASDTAGDGVAVPQSWKLQSWDGQNWQDITLQGSAAYPRQNNAPNAVTFSSPVVTTKLRAVFQATTNGTTFAAVGVSEFAVSATGDVPTGPKSGIQALRSNSFNVAISKETGGVYELGNASDAPDCTNYVMNPDTHPAYNIDDSRWVGDMEFAYNKGGSSTLLRANTSLSDSTRTVQSSSSSSVDVSYATPSTNTYGIKDFGLTESYSLGGANQDQLNWSIKLNNTSGQSLKFQDIAVPMLMNSWWDGGNQTGIYEQNVGQHSFVADDGSYMYWQRPNGQGPYLVMIPQPGTSVEFKDHARAGEGPFGEVDPSWQGLQEFYIHANAVSTTRSGAHLPTTTSTLDAGASQSYGFTFRWAQNYSDLRNVLYNAGVVDVASLPGMVIPQDQQATLAVRAKDGIDSIVGQDGKNITINRASDSNGYQIYKLDFATLGANNVTVNYGGGRKSVLQYYSTEPIQKLVDISTKFLVSNQQAKTSHSYNGAFLQWDMKNKQQISYANYPGGGWEQWMAGGSDDLGLSPAEFLSEKNAQLPDQTQVNALDYYLKNFISGYLQSKKDANGNPTYEVYRWYDGQDGTPADQGTWRAYNYIHVANTWFNMYRIAKAYPQLSTWLGADDYLMRAYNTLKAMYNLPPTGPLGDAANTLGLMGESTLPDILAALQQNNHAPEYSQLLGALQKKANNMFAQQYPFASEASIDTTGFETSYTLAKMFGNTAMATKVQSASLAARGTQPLWYYDGSDNRSMGESWWNLGYETQLGAWQQQDYLQNYPVSDPAEFDEQLRTTYAAYNAGWANINSGQISSDPANYGAASWQYQSELGNTEYNYIPNLNGWWAWSGEADLGFWGGLRTAAVDVVNDDIVGLYSYGGDISEANGAYTIIPKDGVQQRLNMFNEGGLGLVLTSTKYTKAVVAKDLSSIDLTLQNVIGGTNSSTLSLSKLPAGSYNVYVGGKFNQAVSSDGTSATVQLVNLSGDTTDVRVEPAPDKASLQSKTAAAGALNQADYTPATWSALSDAVASAQTVLGDPGANGADVATAISALDNAVNGLVKKKTQTITIDPIGDKSLADADFDVSVSSDSRLPVSLTASGACTVTGVTVHVTQVGTCSLTANQAGSDDFLPATAATLAFAVAKAAQTITFNAIGGHTVGDADFVVSATSSSQLPVSLTAQGTCSLASNIVHITGAGTCSITAVQPGNDTFAGAAPAVQTFAIAQAAQTITFAALGDKVYGDADFTVTASVGSGLPITFTASGVCAIANTTVHVTRPGSCTITATQAGDANYTAAAPVVRSFTVAPARATISAPNVSAVWNKAATVGVTVSATAAPVTGQVQLTEGTTSRGTATLANGQASITLPVGLAGGTHKMTINYLGNDYLAPSSATVTVTVALPTAWNKSVAYQTGNQISFNGQVYQAAWYSKGEQPGTNANGAWELVSIMEDGTTIWTASRIFQAGDQVTYQGKTYLAAWYTRNEVPGSVTGPWEEIATASDGTAIWTPSRIFNAGDVVIYNGQKYTARWYTRNQVPGATNGAWKN